MAELSKWKSVLVHQRNAQTGCIPTGYEWMLKYANVSKVNYATFQDDFDLIQKRLGANDFVSIKKAIDAQYGDVGIRTQGFSDPQVKIAFMQKRVANDQPCLISLAICCGWHVMPVIGCDCGHAQLIHDVDKNLQVVNVWVVAYADIVARQLTSGGNDLAWWEQP